MPRVIYNPATGVINSSSVQTALLTDQTLVICNLYSFANRVFWTYDPTSHVAFWSFTDGDFACAVKYLQLFASGSVQISALNAGNMYYTAAPGGAGVTYLPARRTGVGGALNDAGFKRGPLTYEVGLAANAPELNWFVDDAADHFAPLSGAYTQLINPPVAILPMRQAMVNFRAFDDCPFWIHRAIFTDFPNKGGLFLGTTLMWRGFIRKVEAAADYLKITLASLMQIIQDTPVPTQIIQANSRTGPFLPFPTVGASTLGPYPSAGSIVRIAAKTYTVSGSGIVANQFQDCWVTFNPQASSFNFAPQSGLPPQATPCWKIQSNTASSGGAVNITFYDPPIVPGNVQNINVFSLASGTIGAPGVGNIPPPDNSLSI